MSLCARFFKMHNERINRIRTLLKEAKGEAILISNFFNVFYLTGLTTLTPEEREAFVLITMRNIYYFTDGRYVDDQLLNQMKSIGGSFKLIEMGKLLRDHLKEIFSEEKISELAFEEEDLKFAEYQVLQKLDFKLTPMRYLVQGVREIKSSQEIELIKKASHLSDTCLTELLPVIKVGMTEKELAWKMESWMRQNGYEVAFEPIVAVDKNSAVPHYNTKQGNGVIKNNSILLLDYGVRYKNYNSDITRMVFIGEQPDEVKNTYRGLLASQEKTIQFVQKSKELREIDLFCRAELKKNNLPDFAHSTGHGVGIEVHENPKVSFRSADLLKSNQIFTIEPGVYYTGKFGMRIEDTVVVDEKLHATSLNTFSKTYLQLTL